MRKGSLSTRGLQKSRTADFEERFIRWGRMIGDDCGLEVARVCSTSTAAGLCWFLASQAEIYSQSPGMDTERFGLATSSRAFSIRRRRVRFRAFAGPDSDTSTER